MVARDDNGFTPRKKRCEKAWRQRQKARDKIRQKSRALVKAGVIERTPCVCCGSEENLTIHHLEPLAPGYFVWLCESCHLLAHTPIYRTIRVVVAPGQFCVLPWVAVRPRKELDYRQRCMLRRWRMQNGAVAGSGKYCHLRSGKYCHLWGGDFR